MTTTYTFPGFVVSYERGTGTVTTIYPDGHRSAVRVNADHALHAGRIGAGLTAGEYSLAHELSHHLVAIHVRGKATSPIVRGSAKGMTGSPTEAGMIEEWLATALTYLAFGRDVEDYGALIDVAKRVSPQRLAGLLRWLLQPAIEGRAVTVVLDAEDRG